VAFKRPVEILPEDGLALRDLLAPALFVDDRDLLFEDGVEDRGEVPVAPRAAMRIAGLALLEAGTHGRPAVAYLVIAIRAASVGIVPCRVALAGRHCLVGHQTCLWKGAGERAQTAWDRSAHA